MPVHMKKLLLLACLFIAAKLQAQDAPAVLPTDTVPVIINHTADNNAVKFGSELRPLRGVAGAPAPYYTYFWEFGDGGFSFEKEPQHNYRDTGTFEARLYATNNYDDGKRPPTRPKKIVIKGPKPVMAAVPVPGAFAPGSSVTLKNNCMPKPGDEMMMVLGYRNKNENLKPNLGGTIAILYNDKEFTSNNFDLAESRTYNGETAADLQSMTILTASTVKKQKAALYYASAEPGITQQQIEDILADEKLALREQVQKFKSSKAWHFKDLQAGAERYIFMQFKTTPEMIKDTNATVRLTGVFLPDDPSIEKEVFTVELQIVASHDPNKLSLRKTRMNYRLTSKTRELTYLVRFQNTGKGPAKKVNIGVSLSPVFDVTTIKVSKTKPEVSLYKSAYASQSYLDTLIGKDSVNFIFKNIYLPGTQQEGVNDADSTMGFVEYKIRFKEKPKKLPIYTRAAIIFDKNEPIYTNRAAGKFRRGISPAPILGFGFPINSKSNDYLTERNFTIGASIAPYSPYRQFLQAEIYLSDFKEVSQSKTVTDGRRDTTIGKQSYIISSRSRSSSTKVTTINVVPVSLRYNFNTFVGAGAGVLAAVDINKTTKNNINYKLTGTNGVGDLDLEVLNQKTKKSFSDIRTSFFADVVVGLVRVGPSMGFRYFYDPKSKVSHATTYVTWKF
jgi:PKD repeat protein